MFKIRNTRTKVPRHFLLCFEGTHCLHLPAAVGAVSLLLELGCLSRNLEAKNDFQARLGPL